MYKQAFDNVATKFDGILGVIEHQSSMLEEFINQSEEHGYIVSENYYKALMENERKNITELNKERDEMTKALNDAVNSGAIVKGSEAWYEMVGEIDDVTLAIEEANTAMIEYSNAIRDIEWQVFDLIQEKIHNIAEEADFLISLMENDKLYDDRGQLTDEGQATMGLHGMNYNVYMAQADKYAQEIQKIDEELANDPYNQDLVERRQELLELQRESILAAEDEKQAIVDMVKEGIELELSALKELIQNYEDAIDSQKELYDYQKKVKEQTSEIASLQKQLSAYAGDTSEEGRAKVQQLQVSLQGAQEDLEETQYEKYVSDQKKLLDELYNEYELVLNQRLDNIDDLISDMIAQINAEATGINATLVAQAESVGYTLSTEMSNIWNSSTGTNAVLSVYGEQIAGGVGTLNGTMTAVSAVISGINQNVQNMMASLNQIALSEATIAANSSASKTPTTTPSSGSSSTTTPTPTPSTPSTPAKAPSSSSSSSSKPARTDKEYYGVALAIWNGNYGWGSGSTRVSRLKAKGFDANKVQNIVNQMGREGYVRSGAWVGKYYGITSLSPYHYNKFKLGAFDIPKSQLAWTQEGGKSEAIIRPSDGAILTPIKKGDSVLNGKATANLFGMMTDPGQFILDSLFDGKNITATPSVCNNTNDFSVALENVNFNLPNVKNYDELLTAMQHDKNFERLIMSLTIDRLAGKSSLTKYQAIR